MTACALCPRARISAKDPFFGGPRATAGAGGAAGRLAGTFVADLVTEPIGLLLKALLGLAFPVYCGGWGAALSDLTEDVGGDGPVRGVLGALPRNSLSGFRFVGTELVR